MLLLILKTIILGIIISAPIGPAAILSIKANLTKRTKAGIAIGLGVVASDLIYAIIGIFSASIFFDFIDSHYEIFHIYGGILIILIGIKEFFSNPKKIDKFKIKKDLKIDFLNGFFITIINPLTIFSFFILLAFLGLNNHFSILESIIFLISFFIGCIITWLGLNFLVMVTKRKNEKLIHSKINLIYKICGIILFFIGILMILKP